MASLLVKCFILGFAGFSGIALMYAYFEMVSPEIILIALFTIITTIIPRLFLNFQYMNKYNKDLKTVIMSNSPVLIVGGGGYIGSVLVEELLRRNYKVRVLDKFIYKADVFKDLIHNKNLELIVGDVTNIYDLTLSLQDVQAVIHLAGIVGDPASSLDEKLTRHMNVFSTRILKETVKAFKIPRFIFASSCSVYGHQNTIVDENSALKPVSIYAKTKIDSEKELLSDTSDYFNPTILRFATVYGHSKRPRFDLVVNLFAAKAFVEQNITVTGGAQWRPFVHVRDVSQAIIKTLEAPINKVSRQVFNVGDESQNLQIQDLALLVKDNAIKYGKKVHIETKTQKQDNRNYKVKFQKIKKTLNFKPLFTMDEGISEIFDMFKRDIYEKRYFDPIYNNHEMTKRLSKEFRSKGYTKTHISESEIPEHLN